MTRRATRRRVLSLLSGAAVVTLAGCADVVRSVGDDGSTTGPPSEPSPSPSPSPTPSPTATPTADEPTSTPGYKDYHWHGQLFFEIDGQLVDFTRETYHLDNLEGDDVLGFHFHKSAHGPNEWSNELRVVTLAEGLNLLPGISYERGQDGGHVVSYEGTTYRQADRGTDITVHEGTREINPTRHYVRHAEAFWVRVTTDEGRLSLPQGHPDTNTGTLLVDVNNVRLNPSSAAAVQQGGDESSVHFHDDGRPYQWYAGDGATLGDALGTLEGLTVSRGNGDLVVSLEEPDRFGLSQPERYGGTYRGSDDGTTITVRQRYHDVGLDHPLADGDIIWLYVHTDGAPDNEH